MARSSYYYFGAVTALLLAAIGIMVTLVMLLGSAALPAQAQNVTPGTVITVNTDADEDNVDGDCSLREAIKAADNNQAADLCPVGSASDEDTIVFDLPSSATTITLGSTLPTITSGAGLVIDGGTQGDVTVSGNDAVRVLRVGAGSELDLRNLTVANGNADDAFGHGGGVHNLGTLTVFNSTFSDNSALGFGAGILNEGIQLTVTSSTFSGNSSGDDGGGISNIGLGTVTVTNSTFSNNSTHDRFGFGFGGGIFNSMDTLTVTSSTFSGNSADDGASIANVGGATLRNTIVANSSQGGNCFGTITDGGYNIDDGTTCGFSAANNSQPSTNPLLDSNGLQDNGGPTKTIALQEGSPAIDQGNSFGSTTDQRSVQRPQDQPALQNAPGGDGSDIGAFELENDPPVAQKDSYILEQGKRSLTVSSSTGVLANDSDPEEDALTVSMVRGPQVGTLKLNQDGSFVYKMPKKTFLRNEFNGVTFVYEVSDGAGNTDRAKVTINKG